MNPRANQNINLLIGDVSDPYWGQVFEGMHQAAKQMGVNITYIVENLPFEPSRQEELALLEELKAQKLDVLIDSGTSKFVARGLLETGTALVHLVESDIQHPRSISPSGLYDAARMAGNYLAEAINGKGRVLAAGGFIKSSRSEIGQSRLQGFKDALKKFPLISVKYLPAGWLTADAAQIIETYFNQHPEPFDAIFGLSDMLALTCRDIADSRGCLNANAPSIGINGDPLALAAIVSGKLTATVETFPIQLGRDAVHLALRLADGQEVPNQYLYGLRLVNAQNVNQVSAEKLQSLAELPNRLVNFDRQQHQERMRQLETSLEINRSVGAILDLQTLSLEIVNRIRANYGYDEACLYRWVKTDKVLVTEIGDAQGAARIQISQMPLLGEVIERDQLASTPTVWSAGQMSQTENRSRLVLPIHFSNHITHLMDLHSNKGIFHTRQELIGLQTLADQFGIAIRNAELYQEALTAREEALDAKAQAEKANNLKTRLLANVSQELRSPLRTILDTSRSTLTLPNPGGSLPIKISSNLGIIIENGEHLGRLIDDLLDLSRAEIDELDLSIFAINPRNIIIDAFASIANSPSVKPGVQWQVNIPEDLPVIHADPPRLRQILLNLLSNANKFTKSGRITLGAEISLPYLHLWVSDTGEGIAANIQEHIFEPFITAETLNRRHTGIGLGLTMTRRLVALHGGSISLDTQTDNGSTFHVYLPLPSLTGDNLLRMPTSSSAQPAILLVAHKSDFSPTLANMCSSQSLKALPVELGDDLSKLETPAQPVAIAWDVTHTRPGDWTVIQKLRGHPQYGLLPFLMFGNNPTDDGASDPQQKFNKHQTLSQVIQSYQPDSTKRVVLVVNEDTQSAGADQASFTTQLREFTVTSLNSGTAVNEYLSTETPAMVIWDINTQNTDGFRLLKFLRSQESTATIPVLIMSERNLTEDDIEQLDYDRVIFISKNILTPAETAVRVRRALSEKDFLPAPTSELVKRSLVFIHQNFDHTFTLQEIASKVGISKSYFSQIFRTEVGLPLWEYLNRFRVQKAKDYLRSSVLPVTEISMRVGFDDFSYFGRVFNKYSGCSPRAYRQKEQDI